MGTGKMLLIPMSEYDDLKKEIEFLHNCLSDVNIGKTVIRNSRYGMFSSFDYTTVWTKDHDLHNAIITLEKIKHEKLPIINLTGKTVNDIIKKVSNDQTGNTSGANQ